MSNNSVTALDSHRRWRYFKDRVARYGVALGGIGVIAALVLIFVYLVYIVLPVFNRASIHAGAEYAVPGSEAPSLYLSVEEQGEIGLRVAGNGHVIFFKTADGSLVQDIPLPLQVTRTTTVSQPAVLLPATPTQASRSFTPPPKQVTVVENLQLRQIIDVDANQGLVALGLSDGSLLLARHEYRISYPNNQKTITPELSFPFGEQAMPFAGEALLDVSVRDSDDQLLIAGVTASGQVRLQVISKATSLIDESSTLEPGEVRQIDVPFAAKRVLVNPLQEWLYVLDEKGHLAYFDIRQADNPRLIQQLRVIPDGAQLRQVSFLAGGYSLVVGASDGTISQWFPVRDDDNLYQLKHVRDFQAPEGDLSVLVAEKRRRGFLSGNTSGQLGMYYSTSHRVLLEQDIAESALTRLAISPRANLLLAENQAGKIQTWQVENEYPEVSWSALWGDVWYEGYAEPDQVWQSTAASNDFEPKLSLTPLAFGSIKGAFYAMLFAMPLAIMGAIYTAFFMAPRMRQVVKPTIEVMQALPTVVLGFLAGLWLAPLVEANLPGVFSLFLMLPIFMLVFGYGWSRLSPELRRWVPEGWEATILIPVLVLLGWLTFLAGGPLEIWLFNGNLPQWMDQELGISYDQRNCLVVGLAMGFAVIPTIFSISEDAIFGVPKHLVNGSLALGATSWQTVIGVVLPTASPGIFSGVMIGMGRAVGETMIVLMATGNTPVIDMSMFSGMRTLSANVAVEMPESEVGSTHFRVLFLAALVLFVFTFILNTLAELVRQRLRERYSNI